jgi:hypothetical protein
MRNLFAMDSVTARAILTRVEDKLVSVFLSQQQQQHSQHASSTAQDMLHTDLYEADKVLRRLQGQTVSECNANKEELCRLSSMYRSSGCSEVTCPSIQYMSTRTLVCIASILIASNVGSDLERTKAINRSFRLSKTCEFVISKELDSTILVDKLKAMQKNNTKLDYHSSFDVTQIRDSLARGSCKNYRCMPGFTSLGQTSTPRTRTSLPANQIHEAVTCSFSPSLSVSRLLSCRFRTVRTHDIGQRTQQAYSNRHLNVAHCRMVQEVMCVAGILLFALLLRQCGSIYPLQKTLVLILLISLHRCTSPLAWQWALLPVCE